MISNMFKGSVAILVAITLVGCGEKAAKVEDNAPLIRPAKLLKVGMSAKSELVNFPAVIQARQSSDLAFQVEGVIIDLAVTEGMSVKRGQLLAQLDSRDFKSKVDVATAQFENADAEYQRALKLNNSSVISKSELAKRKADYEVTKSQLESATKALEDTTLRAPYDGRVAKVLFQNQESIKKGAEVFHIMSLNQLEAKIDLPSRSVVRAGRNAGHDIEAYVILDAAPEYQIKASFKEAALEADQESQTYEVIFGFEAIDELIILPGMSANVLFKNWGKKEGPAHVSIPLTAVGIDGDTKFVWVVDTKTMAVSKQNIVVEAAVGEQLEVLSGLTVDQTIVAAGISSLVEGNIVRPWVK